MPRRFSCRHIPMTAKSGPSACFGLLPLSFARLTTAVLALASDAAHLRYKCRGISEVLRPSANGKFGIRCLHLNVKEGFINRKEGTGFRLAGLLKQVSKLAGGSFQSPKDFPGIRRRGVGALISLKGIINSPN